MPEQSWEERCCDLVMRGGVTSGIVYPRAIEHIAKEFTLIGIGGTSAGGIAAGIAAAAEYRRRETGSLEGFELLGGIPDDLKQDGRITDLFRPDLSTVKLHKQLLKYVTKDEGRKKKRIKVGLLKIGAALTRAWWNHKPLLANNYGICSGMANGNPPPAGTIAPLTAWLYAQMQEAAGLDHDDVLTFGHLHHAKVPGPLQAMVTTPGYRAIDLRMVTTCLSYGRPVEMPNGFNRFGFDEEEWRGYFPHPVVNHLVRHAEARQSETWPRDGKLYLTMGEEMPVIAAVRMSLSFPLLFSMVPAYTVNFDVSEKPLSRVWFSDGGITSNFPVHRFDSLFPRWPTFGINLKYTDRHGNITRRGARDTGLYLPQQRGGSQFGDLRDIVNEPAAATIKDLAGLAMGGIFSSAQNWHDSSYLQLDMFRDRVVEVWLNDQEGGMNLAMAPDLIEGLAQRGRDAAVILCDRFRERRSKEPMSWDGHRWARYTATMAGLMESLHRFKRNVDQHGTGELSLQDLLRDGMNPPCYPPTSQDSLDAMEDATRRLLDYIDTTAGYGLCDNEAHQPFCNRPKPPAGIGLRVPF